MRALQLFSKHRRMALISVLFTFVLVFGIFQYNIHTEVENNLQEKDKTPQLDTSNPSPSQINTLGNPYGSDPSDPDYPYDDDFNSGAYSVGTLNVTAWFSGFEHEHTALPTDSVGEWASHGWTYDTTGGTTIVQSNEQANTETYSVKASDPSTAGAGYLDRHFLADSWIIDRSKVYYNVSARISADPQAQTCLELIFITTVSGTDYSVIHTFDQTGQVNTYSSDATNYYVKHDQTLNTWVAYSFNLTKNFDDGFSLAIDDDTTFTHRIGFGTDDVNTVTGYFDDMILFYEVDFDETTYNYFQVAKTLTDNWLKIYKTPEGYIRYAKMTDANVGDDTEGTIGNWGEEIEQRLRDDLYAIWFMYLVTGNQTYYNCVKETMDYIYDNHLGDNTGMPYWIINYSDLTPPLANGNPIVRNGYVSRNSTTYPTSWLFAIGGHQTDFIDVVDAWLTFANETGDFYWLPELVRNNDSRLEAWFLYTVGRKSQFDMSFIRTLPSALYYAYALTGNNTYLTKMKSMLQSWWKYSRDCTTDLVTWDYMDGDNYNNTVRGAASDYFSALLFKELDTLLVLYDLTEDSFYYNLAKDIADGYTTHHKDTVMGMTYYHAQVYLDGTVKYTLSTDDRNMDSDLFWVYDYYELMQGVSALYRLYQISDTDAYKTDALNLYEFCKHNMDMMNDRSLVYLEFAALYLYEQTNTTQYLTDAHMSYRFMLKKYWKDNWIWNAWSRATNNYNETNGKVHFFNFASVVLGALALDQFPSILMYYNSIHFSPVSFDDLYTPDLANYHVSRYYWDRNITACLHVTVNGTSGTTKDVYVYVGNLNKDDLTVLVNGETVSFTHDALLSYNFTKISVEFPSEGYADIIIYEGDRYDAIISGSTPKVLATHSLLSESYNPATEIMDVSTDGQCITTIALPAGETCYGVIDDGSWMSEDTSDVLANLGLGEFMQIGSLVYIYGGSDYDVYLTSEGVPSGNGGNGGDGTGGGDGDGNGDGDAGVSETLIMIIETDKVNYHWGDLIYVDIYLIYAKAVSSEYVQVSFDDYEWEYAQQIEVKHYRIVFDTTLYVTEYGEYIIYVEAKTNVHALVSDTVDIKVVQYVGFGDAIENWLNAGGSLLTTFSVVILGLIAMISLTFGRFYNNYVKGGITTISIAITGFFGWVAYYFQVEFIPSFLTFGDFISSLMWLIGLIVAGITIYSYMKRRKEEGHRGILA